MPSNPLVLCHPLLLLLSIFPSIRVFSSHQVAKVLELQLPRQSFQWNIQGWFPLGLTGLISLQSTELSKNLLQHDSLKASILWHSTSFIDQFSHLYMTTGKTIALTIWTFVDKVMPLLFNTLSRFVIAFLPRSKRLLISLVQSLSTVIMEPKKRKSVTASAFYPSVCHEVMGPDAAILAFLKKFYVVIYTWWKIPSIP